MGSEMCIRDSNFLQTYPDYFDVTLTGQKNSKNKPLYNFKVKGSINDAVPAVGGSTVPAVGGSSSSIAPQPPAVPPPAQQVPPRAVRAGTGASCWRRRLIFKRLLYAYIIMESCFCASKRGIMDW